MIVIRLYIYLILSSSLLRSRRRRISRRISRESRKSTFFFVGILGAISCGGRGVSVIRSSRVSNGGFSTEA
jgi:hypothetical protein